MASSKLQYLKSAFAENCLGISIPYIQEWLREQNEMVQVDVRFTKFSKLKGWRYERQKQSICHDSGKFFSIDGIDIRTNWGNKSQWQQPIINQPEVGYLGFIVKEFDGVLHFLMQAKIEPGNVNNVQLSPTLQATRSNFSQVHKGKKPDYLEYFQYAKPHQILLDQLQSEQGARFLKKRNRNIIIKINDDIPVKPNFIWLTLAQIKQLMQYDDLINMDSRTVISGIPFGNYDEDVVEFFNYLQRSTVNTFAKEFFKSALTFAKAHHSTDDLISRITHFKSVYDLYVTKVDLKELSDWIYTDEEIFHTDRKYFRVIPVDVKISSREVTEWSQPMVQPAQEGLCAFVCKKIEGILHFAVQIKLECGNHDVVELAPTVQTLTGDYKTAKEGSIPFLQYVLQAKSDQVIFDTLQSEEGGRFYREQNRNMIVIAGDDIEEELPDKYIWMTLNQLGTFLKFNNYLNIQARSLIAAISFN